jgi:hypothetical protein
MKKRIIENSNWGIYNGGLYNSDDSINCNDTKEGSSMTTVENDIYFYSGVNRSSALNLVREIRQTGNDANIVVFTNTSASPYGPNIYFTAATPNNTTNYFLTGGDNTNDKFFIYSNGNMVNRNGSYGTISDVKFKEIQGNFKEFLNLS